LLMQSIASCNLQIVDKYNLRGHVPHALAGCTMKDTVKSITGYISNITCYKVLNLSSMQS